MSLQNRHSVFPTADEKHVFFANHSSSKVSPSHSPSHNSNNGNTLSSVKTSGMLLSNKFSTASAMTGKDLAQSIFHASGNSKIGMKMFRSHKAIMEEQKRQRETSGFVIHPFSSFRSFWDVFMVVILIFTLISLPINIAFYSEDITVQWTIINCLTDTLFVVDIILNFFTGVVLQHNEEIELSRKKIIWNYLKGWFVLDLLSSFPFDYIYIGLTDSDDISDNDLVLTLRALRLVKVMSLLRLLRLSRLLRYVHRLEEMFDIEGAIIRIVNLVLVVLMLTHWNGCIQFLVPFLLGFPDDTWVSIDNLVNATKWEQYSWSFYRAISQTLSIGVGRRPPDCLADMWITTLSMMIGATFYALFIGNMSSLLLSIDASGRLYNERINQVKEYMRYRKIPVETQRRVMDYYDHRFQRKFFDEESILHEQNHLLREEIVQTNCKQLVNKVDFLSKGTPDYTNDVIQKLCYEVFLPGDYIIKAGTRGDTIYFIENGLVDILIDDEIVSELSDGDHFGEIALLVDERRVASVIAKATCYVYCLNRKDFQAVLSDHPDMREKMEAVAKERLLKIGRVLEEPQEMEQRDRTSESISMECCGNIEPETQRLTELSSICSNEDDNISPITSIRVGSSLPPINVRPITVPTLAPVSEVLPTVDNSISQA